jgi:hypothetical protein
MHQAHAMTTPDWLTQRGGSLKLGCDGKTWYVLIECQTDYSLVAVPSAGQFVCVIRQTTNGARIECKGTYATKGEAINAGLDELRKRLGWG